MTRTKWIRLGVRDPADVMRWAAVQNARHLDEFRYRVIHGREFVSFRMVPRYAIRIGTSDIVVVAHVKPRPQQRLATAAIRLWQGLRQRAFRAFASRGARAIPAAPASGAKLYHLAAPRLSSPLRG